MRSRRRRDRCRRVQQSRSGRLGDGRRDLPSLLHGDLLGDYTGPALRGTRDCRVPGASQEIADAARRGVALAAQTRCLAEQNGMPVATRKHDSRARWIRSGAALSSGRRFAARTVLCSLQRSLGCAVGFARWPCWGVSAAAIQGARGTGSRCRGELCVMCCGRRTSFNGRIDDSRFKISVIAASPRSPRRTGAAPAIPDGPARARTAIVRRERRAGL